MPLNERYYLRGYSNRFPNGVKWLLISTIGIFICQFLATLAGFGEIFRPFYLSPYEVVTRFTVWQMVTYMFLHDPFGIGHILFNMLALWMFGTDLEGAWGTNRFLKFYLLCGVGAALCVVVVNLLVGNPYARTIGASGAIFGLLLAFGMLFPDRQLWFWFLFPIKAKYFVMIIGAIELYMTLAAPGGPVSNIAHLGGMAFGYFFIKSQQRRPVSPFGQVRRRHRSFGETIKGWQKEWRVRRARKQFEKYMRDRDRDRMVH